MTKKLIFHIDLNAFYCQCAENEEPFLKDVPFAIANDNNTDKGIISTSNYIARGYGVYSAMSILEAKKKCPYIRLVPPNFNLYKRYSNLFFKFLKSYTNTIEKASIDECYLDLTNHSLAESPLLLAKKIQDELIKKYNLPTSIGISHTTFLAKMASDLKKPKGITYLTTENLSLLDNLSISKVYGIGKKTAAALTKLGIEKISDFKRIENRQKIINKLGANFYNKKIDELNGKSSDIVTNNENHIPKSISAEMTFNYLISNREILLDNLKETFKRAYNELLSYNQTPESITIKFKLGKSKTLTKIKNLKKKTQDEEILYSEVELLFDELYDTLDNKELILIGCGFTKFSNNVTIKKDEPRTLFNYESKEKVKEEKLSRVIDKINKKHNGKIKWNIKDE